LEIIALNDARKGAPENPVVSPDGTLVAFHRELPPKNHRQLLYTAVLYLTDIDGAYEDKILDMRNYLECAGWR
jgi:hypothetical protein